MPKLRIQKKCRIVCVLTVIFTDLITIILENIIYNCLKILTYC